MKGKGVNRLALAIDNRTDKRTAAPPSMDLGTITDDGLKLDQFGPVIPRSGYLIAEWMVDAHFPTKSRIYRTASPVGPTGEDTPDTTYSQEARLDFLGGEDGGHVPSMELRFSPSLQTGDRVLVLWVRDDPVVVSKVVPADA
ncbi:MAG: peptide methionine sulfoxide reductase [Paenibacillus macerans]|uniref:peptide methionine sulfoxide reductase n=1 Tax=Paenibacillus macerans TaxID=44252 RepID=UPI001F0E1AF7|nr:peptide methionine sulfoxide reductase [Paenibacillus macerans]MDU7473630.1 peptide methionine sulfoxide reductase [Paenibacillus macerans]MEC0139214.1 peptide methionine sulfoxide reductase [Paenibacillus macerans]UMV47295.1 peptide methionine sulfoxide reductase [Paenibacillus macerans]